MPHLKKIVFYNNSNVNDLGPPGLFSYYNLVEIVIPRLVKVIPSHLFENCHFLENVHFEEGSLLNEIGEFSFSKTKIRKIILPDSVNIIKQSAFSFNNNLKKVIFKGEIIEQEAFLYTGIIKFSLSNNTRYIGKNAFQYCHKLTEFDIDIDDSNLTEIDEYAFSDTSINEINIPPNIKTIKKYTFNGCKNLKRVNISNDSNLEIIEEYSFAGDISLETINIPKSIINISPTTFINTPSLISIMIESNEKYYVMEDYLVYLKNDINLELIFVPRYLNQIRIIQSCSKINSGAFCGSNLKEVIFPDLSLKCIGYCAFAHTTELEKIVIPQSLLIIEDEAFIDCQNLKIVEFDQCCQLKEIPKYCFSFTSLSSINLPNSIEIINDYSFYFCSRLKNIDISNTKVRYIGDSAFYETSIEEIRFPSSIEYISNHSFENTRSLKLIDFTNCQQLEDYQKLIENKKSIRSFISKNKRIKKISSLNQNKKAKLAISNFVLVSKPNTKLAISNPNENISTPKIIRPVQSNKFQLFTSVACQTNMDADIIQSPRIIQSPSIIQSSSIKQTQSILNNENDSNNVDRKIICYIHESSFKNSRAKTIIFNFNEYKWLSFIDKFFEIKQYVVNQNIRLYMKRLVNERKPFNKTVQLLGKKYKVSKVEWKSDELFQFNEKQLTPFHFLNSIKLTKIVLTNDLDIKSIPKCLFSFTCIKEITIPSTVLEIKASAFKYCNELEIFKFLPNSNLKKIEDFAFYGCCNLKNISIPNGVKLIPFKCFAFSGLTEITFSDTIEKVEKMAFFNCKNLSKIIFNEGLRELDDSSFANNIFLENIDLPNSLEKIYTRAFSNCINLKYVNTTQNSKLVEIYNFSFENTKIEELKLNPNIKKLFEPKDVPLLNKISFYEGELINFIQFKDGTIYENIDNLNKISQIKESNDDINKEKKKYFDFIMQNTKKYKLVFAPKNLKRLEIHESCVSIGNYVLNGMKYLKTIEYISEATNYINDFPNYYNINDNIKHIKISSKYSYLEYCKFSYFTSLEIVEFGKLTNLFFIPKFAFKDCKNLKKVSIPYNCTQIEEGSFKNCINLSSFEFIKTNLDQNDYDYKIYQFLIENEAFYNCSSLTDFIVPAIIEKIGKKAFMNCTKLKHFEIDNDDHLCFLYSIGESSFKNCVSLEKISFLTEAAYIGIGNSAFMNCSNLQDVSINGRCLYNIDFRAFYNCVSLVNFKFTHYNYLNESYFDYIFLGFESFMNCSTLKNFIIDMSLANIENIENQKELKYNKQTIQRNAFCDCKLLTKVQLLIGNLQEIQENAFYNCSSLQILEINSNENLFLPKNLNCSAFINAPNDLPIKLINNQKEIISLNVSNILKPRKTGIKTFKKYSSKLKKLNDDDFEINSKFKFSNDKMCFLFAPPGKI